MKKWIGLVALMALMAHADDNYRELTASDGRKLKARILSYDGKTDKVQIEREDGKKLTVAAKAFSDRDRLYFKTWNASQAFTSNAKVKLEIKREAGDAAKKNIEVDVGDEGGGGGRRGGGGDTGVIIVAVDKTMPYQFNLLLENKSGTPLRNITMEYRVFYKQDKAVKDEKANKNRREDDPRPERYMAVTEEKVKEGRVKLKPIENGETKELSTTAVKLLSRSANRNWGENIDLKSDVVGVWFKLTMKGPGGEKLERNMALPPSIMKKYPWDQPDPVQPE